MAHTNIQHNTVPNTQHHVAPNTQHHVAPNTQHNNEEKKKEHFTSNCSGWYKTYGILHFVAFVFAIYLSFKCHGGFDFWSFVVAFFCPWIYIVWVLATKKGFCSDSGKLKID